MDVGYDNCIICGTSMSPFSKNDHMSKGWVASLCSACRDELATTYGQDMTEQILSRGSVVDKLMQAYNLPNEDDQDKMINEIIDLVEDMLDQKSSIIDKLFKSNG